MLNNKQNTKKISAGPLIIDGIVMKPDWNATFLRMEVGASLVIHREQLEIPRLRTRLSTLGAQGKGSWEVNLIDGYNAAKVTRKEKGQPTERKTKQHVEP